MALLFVISYIALLSGGDLPVSVGQVGHDLDAKLLEFKLMANAREQAAYDSHKAEEAKKLAWTQAETKRIKDMVREQLRSQISVILVTSQLIELLGEATGEASSHDDRVVDVFSSGGCLRLEGLCSAFQMTMLFVVCFMFVSIPGCTTTLKHDR